jgi:hypothetical protein
LRVGMGDALRVICQTGKSLSRFIQSASIPV